MQPHITILLVNTVQPGPFEDFKASLEPVGVQVDIVRREPPGPMAAIEWLVPTFVVGFVASAYFGGFFQEMGKDHYLAVKARFHKLYDSVAGPKSPTISLVGTEGKVRGQQPYSLYFSLVGEGPGGLRFKLLLRRPVTEEEFCRSVDAFLDFLLEVQTSTPRPDLVRRLAEAKPMGQTMLLVYHPETDSIAPINPRTGEVVR